MTDPVQKKRRWDLIVKMTHWGIVAAIIGNGMITGEKRYGVEGTLACGKTRVAGFDLKGGNRPPQHP